MGEIGFLRPDFKAPSISSLMMWGYYIKTNVLSKYKIKMSMIPNDALGFDKRPTALEVIKNYDLRGCNAIVTGGASGIGVETVRALATQGARVTVATRNIAMAESVVAGLREATHNPEIEVSWLDLSSLASVKACAGQFLAKKIALHFLFNNAGIMATPLAYSIDGFESQFATNYLGHFAFSMALLPALKAAGKARVITLTSIAHLRSDIQYEDIHFRKRTYDAWSAYGQSNTATALLAVGITHKYQSYGITANAVMPGGIMTGLQKHITREKQIELGWIDEAGVLNPNFKNAEQGAATSIWAAVAPELENRGGLYLQNCSIAEPWTSQDPLIGYKPYAISPSNAERLWNVSEKMIAI